MRYVVVIPTYNEAENVPLMAERLLALDPAPDVLVVDDASPDGTGEVADAIAAANPRVRVLHRTGPRGYAAASVEGLSWARSQGYDVACTMDADLSHDPARLPAMLERIADGADAVIGSRYVPGGRLEVHWGAFRRAVSRAGSAYAHAMLAVGVKDCTSGFRAYSGAALAAIRFEAIESDGYCFLIEVLDHLRRAGCRVDEVPITYIERQLGRSKISRRIILEALVRTTVLGLRRVLGGRVAGPGQRG